MVMVALLVAPGVVAADERDVPANVSYAKNPQPGVGNSFSAPYQWWKVALKTGDTLKASITVTSEAGDDVYLSLYLPGTTNASQNTKVASAPPEFTYTATQSGDFLFAVYSFDDADTAYTISWVRTPAPLPSKVTLSTPIAPATMTKGVSRRVYGYLSPRHKAGTTPVRIYMYKKVDGVWQARGNVLATVADYESYSRYSTALTLGSKGTWRIRAYYPKTARFPAAWSPAYDVIRVE
jgi:hypothetical protein